MLKWWVVLFLSLVIIFIMVINDLNSIEVIYDESINYFRVVEESSDTVKFFPFGWWIHPGIDTTEGKSLVDSVFSPASKMNTVLLPQVYDTHHYNRVLEYAADSGLYIIVDFPKFRAKASWTFDNMDYDVSYDQVHYPPDPNQDADPGSSLDDGWWWDSTEGYISFLKEESSEKTYTFHKVLEVADSSDSGFTLHYDITNCKETDVLKAIHRNSSTGDTLYLNIPWISFKIKKFEHTDEPFQFIAETYAHYDSAGESWDKKLYVELDSRHWDDIPSGQCYHDDSIITVSLQNQGYFSDVDTSDDSPNFPLYDRNPYSIIDISYTLWYTVFVMLDTIIYDFTDSVGDPYILDSLVSFKFVGTHYYLKDLEFRSNPQNMKTVDKRQAITQ